MKAQLPKTTSTPSQYINSDNWAMQQKIDGWRMILSCGSEGVKTFNRNGEPLECPENIKEYFSVFTVDWTFDGELLDGIYYIFDLLAVPTGSVTSWPLSRRYEMLNMLSNKFDGPIELVPLITENKQEKFDEIKSNDSEGVVFKLLSAPYAGKRTSNFLKYKFVNQVDCVVIDKGFNSKENFVLGLFDGKGFVDVGKCSSLTGDGPKVKVGDVVQVTTLYVTEGNRLYQPVKPQLRYDKSPQDCTLDQLDLYRTNKEVLL